MSHVHHKNKISYCGETISNMQFYFLNKEHALNSLKNQMTTQPCKKCMLVINEREVQ